MKKTLVNLFFICSLMGSAQNTTAERSTFNSLKKRNTKVLESSQAKVAATAQHIDSTLRWTWKSNLMNWDTLPDQRTSSYVYDAQDRVISKLTSQYSGVWNNATKEDFTYDGNGNMTSSLRYIWSGSGWNNSQKMTWTYNSANNLIDRSAYSGSLSAWIGSYRYISTYNTAQDKTQELHQVWLNNAWQDWDKTVFTYDANHNNLTETSSTWTNSAWVNSSKYSYTYNAANAITSALGQKWNGSAWINDEKQTVSYDLANDPVYFLGQLWNNNAWENDAQATFTCSNHDIVREEWQQWNANTWVNDDIYTYTYTPTHLELQSIHLVWNGSSHNNWAKYVHTYDANGNKTNYKYYSWNNNAWLQVFNNSWKYDANNFNYCLVNRSIYGPGYGDSTYIYYKTVVGLEKNTLRQNTLSVYPNPGKGNFTLVTKHDWGKIEVFDLVGKPVFQGKIESLNTPLNLSELSKGIYIIVVSQGKTRETVKIAIE